MAVELKDINDNLKIENIKSHTFDEETDPNKLAVLTDDGGNL